MVPKKGRSSSSTLLNSYACIIRNQIAYCTQAQGCQVATETNAYFVAAFEGGSNDGGIRLGSPAVGDDITERYFNTVGQDSETEDIVPIDVKSIAPGTDTNQAIIWRYQFTPAQVESCQAAIFRYRQRPRVYSPCANALHAPQATGAQGNINDPEFPAFMDISSASCVPARVCAIHATSFTARRGTC